jgi:DNA helicase-2/ATP-dependent DNA helicase PcrA
LTCSPSTALPEHNAQIAEFLELSQLLKAQMFGLDDSDEGDFEPIEEQARRLDLDSFLLKLHIEVERQRRHVDIVWRTSEDAVFDLVRLLDQNLSNGLPDVRVIVIDEMQDMNPITARLVEHQQRAPRTFVTAAGDFDQVIHSRRGATVDFVMSLVNAAGVERLRLSKTFRHGPAMAHATAFKKTTPTVSGRVVRADIWVREYSASDPVTAVPHVVKAIKTWRTSDEGNKSEDQAVILRSPHLSIEIEGALTAEGIAYRCEGFDSYLVRPETLVLRGIVAYALKAPETIANPATRLRALEAMLQWQEFVCADARLQDLEVASKDASTWAAFVEGLLLRPRTAGDNADAQLSEEQVAVRESVQLARIRELEQAGRRTEAEDMRTRVRDARTRIVETPRERAARERLQRVVHYLDAADPALPAHVVLLEVARLLDVKAVARRIFIEANNAREASASIDGFIALARSQDKPLPEFAKWLQAQELALAKTRANRALLLATVEAAKAAGIRQRHRSLLERGRVSACKRSRSRGSEQVLCGHHAHARRVHPHRRGRSAASLRRPHARRGFPQARQRRRSRRQPGLEGIILARSCTESLGALSAYPSKSCSPG